MGGEVTVQSAPAAGATFAVMFRSAPRSRRIGDLAAQPRG
jgi:hypothetical protein